MRFVGKAGPSTDLKMLVKTLLANIEVWDMNETVNVAEDDFSRVGCFSSGLSFSVRRCYSRIYTRYV
jgi:hypothetical protein